LSVEQQKLINDDPIIIRRYVARDVHIIVHELKGEAGDFMVTLPGWEQSVGASAEVNLAKWLHLKVLPFGEIYGKEEANKYLSTVNSGKYHSTWRW
jgi:hypothetical protein